MMDIDAKGMTPQDVKESMKQGMLDNFKNYGYLTPMVFIHDREKIIMDQIPGSFFESSEEKQRLAMVLRMIGMKPTVKCIGVIFEAYGTIQHQDSEMVPLLKSGNLKVSELSTRLDIVCMTYSSRTEDDLISYIVDPKTRTVKEEFAGGANPDGVFSNLLAKRV